MLEDIKKCDICKKKFGFDPNPVVWGELNSKIMQISQAPSNRVHESLKPFTDQSGKTLIHEWYQIPEEEFYNKNNFYIGAMAHCYPGKDSRGNDKAPPKICYETWIKREIELINNEIYIIIGSKAASKLFPNSKFEVLVFKNNELNGRLAIVLPHPSPLNRKWIKDHPEFLNKRIVEIREIINNIIEHETKGE